MYIHQQKGWPRFIWDEAKISSLLASARYQQGLLLGAMGSLGFEVSQEVILDAFTQDVVKTSEIEGEFLDRSQVRSSLAKKLGIDVAATPIDRHAEGVVKMLLDATQHYNQPLTASKLFYWHSLLFPSGHSGYSKIQVAKWRKSSVQVVSGRAGRETVHFEGPDAIQVDKEMKRFFAWANKKQDDWVLKAAIAHLWFVTIHPFDDGNGRIGRAIADLLLARSEKNASRFYSLSAQIQAERKEYYRILEKTQKGGLDITDWIEWFILCFMKAIDKAFAVLTQIKTKQNAWQALSQEKLNERQRKMINLLLDGFHGKLTSSKWAKITKSSQDTAHRDILDLVDRGILMQSLEGGRSTHYILTKGKNNTK